jgi:hypothetical protein
MTNSIGYHEAPHISDGECSLAPSTKDIDARLTTVEHSITYAKGIITGSLAVATICAGLAGWALKGVFDLSVKTGKIETLLTNKIAVLSANPGPGDPGAVAKSFDNARELLTQTDKGKKISKETVNSISKSLADQMPLRGSVPSYWKLASVVLERRSEYTGPPAEALPDCLHGKPYPEHDAAPGPDGQFHAQTDDEQRRYMSGRGATTVFTFDSCILKLDDPDFQNSAIAQKMRSDERYGAVLAASTIFIGCNQCVVTYNGGPVIPVTTLFFTNSKFRIDAEKQHPQPVQVITRTLLASDTIQSQKIEIPPA